MNIIGVCGRASSGKDTVAMYLVKRHHFVHLHLAFPIKEFVQHIFGFTNEQLYGSSHYREKKIRVERTLVDTRLEHYGHYWLHMLGHPDAFPLLEEAIESLFYWHVRHDQLNARIALQYLGTEFGRECLGQDVWVDAALMQAQQYLDLDSFHGVVISDVRFTNEVNAIKHAGGRLIRLLRNASGPIPGITNHPSELEQATIPIAAFDCIINNIGTISDLHRSVETFLLCNHKHLSPTRHRAAEELHD